MKSRKNILIIEDQTPLAKLLQINFSRKNLTADISYNGKSALKNIETTEYDIVISDYSLPDTKIEELLSNITKILPDAKIILVSAYNLPGDTLKKTFPQIKAILQKPFKLEKINLIIDKYKKIS